MIHSLYHTNNVSFFIEEIEFFFVAGTLYPIAFEYNKTSDTKETVVFANYADNEVLKDKNIVLIDDFLEFKEYLLSVARFGIEKSLRGLEKYKRMVDSIVIKELEHVKEKT